MNFLLSIKYGKNSRLRTLILTTPLLTLMEQVKTIVPFIMSFMMILQKMWKMARHPIQLPGRPLAILILAML